MAVSITAESLFLSLQQEKATGELQPLPHDFYANATALVATLSKQDQGEEKARRVENVVKMLMSLKEKRKQKLLLYIAYSRPLPATIPNEEEALFNELHKTLNAGAPETKLSKLKIISDVPEVLTSQGRKVGPYKHGEIVELSDSGDVEFIIKNKIGEILVQ
ncbi:MAG: hypothetical protein KGI04_03345 [Candidatus Micrarchaeota archaeon]|nr:hypothetical protein [Candidatus Micrarchaeota archaeon]